MEGASVCVNCGEAVTYKGLRCRHCGQRFDGRNVLSRSDITVEGTRMVFEMPELPELEGVEVPDNLVHLFGDDED